LQQIPAVIRAGADDARAKLELAIIENLQREDLNPVDRAHAFDRLAKEFGFKHGQIGEKVGKSREYVSNTLRLLSLPEEMLQALTEGKISEGHTRPLLMLADRKEEQQTLFKEILTRRLTVREAEGISRRVAVDRARKVVNPEIVEMEQKFTEKLGTRVQIDQKEQGGKIVIDFFSPDDLRMIFDMIEKGQVPGAVLSQGAVAAPVTPASLAAEAPVDDSTKQDSDEDLYSIKNFSI
jgi:ParB family chromosome partitioning protein